MKKLLLLLFLVSPLFAQNKLILLFSPPRSMSTLFLRMMTEREDFVTYNEPATPLFCKTELPNFDIQFNEEALWSYEEIAKRLEEERQHAHVFVKDLGTRLLPLFDVRPKLRNDPDVHCIFLVRNPLSIAHSLYHGFMRIPNVQLENYDFGHLIHLKELYEAYTASPRPPHLLFAEDLIADPKQEVASFCEKVGIPFSESHLSWKPCLEGELPDWHENKLRRDVYIWHQSVLESSGFQPISPKEVPPEIFQVIESGYLQNLSYYHFFQSERSS